MILKELIILPKFSLLLPQKGRELSLEFAFLLFFLLLELDEESELVVCLLPLFHIVLDHRLNGPDFLEVEAGKGIPELGCEVIAELLIQLGTHQKDLLLLLELVPHHQRKSVIVFVSTVFELEEGESTKEFMEVLFVPIEYHIEVRVAGDLAGVELAILSEYLDFSELELEVLHHDGVVAVVLEEHDVALVFEAVGFVVAGLGLGGCCRVGLHQY